MLSKKSRNVVPEHNFSSERYSKTESRRRIQGHLPVHVLSVFFFHTRFLNTCCIPPKNRLPRLSSKWLPRHSPWPCSPGHLQHNEAMQSPLSWKPCLRVVKSNKDSGRRISRTTDFPKHVLLFQDMSSFLYLLKHNLFSFFFPLHSWVTLDLHTLMAASPWTPFLVLFVVFCFSTSSIMISLLSSPSLFPMFFHLHKIYPILLPYYLNSIIIARGKIKIKTTCLLPVHIWSCFTTFQWECLEYLQNWRDKTSQQ